MRRAQPEHLALFHAQRRLLGEGPPSAALPPGVVVCSLRRAAQEFPEKVEACYGRLARTGKDALNALNTMLAQDGLFVYVPRGVAVERTIQVVNLLRSDVGLMVNRRVLVVFGRGAGPSPVL